MDVTCERCSTEYEFDDALVSERGTTVKCTNCGHQFKVRRGDGGGAPERWVVRTVDGRELEFTMLRELQASITQGRIVREDVLSRGTSRPRRLGSIAELEPFFTQAGSAITSTQPGVGQGQSTRSRVPTPAGLGDAAPRFEGSVAIPLPIAPPREQYGSMPPLVPRRAADPPPPTRGYDAMPGTRPYTHDGNAVMPTGTLIQGGSSSVATPGGPGSASFGAPMSGQARGPVTTPSAGAGSAPVYAGAAADPYVASGRPASVPPPGKIVSPDSAPPLPRDGRRFERTLPSEAPLPTSTGPSQVAVASAPPYPQRPPHSSDPFGSTVPDPEPPTMRRNDGMPSAPPPPLPPPDPPRGSFQSLPTPTPTDVRGAYRESDAGYTEPRFSSVVPSKRSGAGRWIAGVVLLGVVVLVGVTVGRKYLTGGPKPEAGASATDERVAGFLAAGEQALAEGDLESAKSQLDKASGLAEKEPKVAVALARLEVVRADFAWLKLRLLATDDPGYAAAKDELGKATARMRGAVDRAVELAPSDPVVLRARLDALRIAGDKDGARKLVPGLGGAATQAEGELTLAALELSEDAPTWRTVIDRLRDAARAEQALGRARALLVYALARSGDVAGAKQEIAALDAKPHPLGAALHGYVDAVEKNGGKPVDVSSLPNVDSGEPQDAGEAMKMASQARAKGNLKRARELLLLALQKSPNDLEATAALAEVELASGDRASAKKRFEAVLAKNPVYLPALMGLADLKWDEGDRGGAIALYKQVLDKGPASAYASRAKERVGQGAPQAGTSGGAAPPPHQKEEPSVPDNYAPPPGGTIDTSDLPGYHPPPQPAPTSQPTAQPTSKPSAPSPVDTSDLPGGGK